MSAARDFGIQSFCLRAFKDVADVAAKVRQLGLDKIEVCGVHADFNDLADWKERLKVFEGEGVQVTSIGVEGFSGADAEKAKFDAAAAAGAKHISAHFDVRTFQDAVPKVRGWCREYGIKIGIHCHGGYAFGGQPPVLKYLIELGGPEIGLNIDTAWAMQIGPGAGNPIKWVEQFAGHIHGVHYKDFVFERNGAWEDVVVGTGNLDLPAFVKALEDTGFDGMAVIEYEGNPDDPMDALQECVQSMRAAF